MNFSVTKNGVPLDPKLYNWDEETKTFSTNENGLVLDFSGINGITFKTGPSCTFNTGSSCTFDTGSHCTFDTGSYCIFNTGLYCTFKTGPCCTFDTGSGCVIVRRDIFEVIVLEKDNNYIKLNDYKIPGFKEIKEKHKIVIDNKEIEISDESFKNLKKQLLEQGN